MAFGRALSALFFIQLHAMSHWHVRGHRIFPAKRPMPADEPISFEFFAMGSPCSISLFMERRDAASRIADAAIDEVHRIEQRYSRYLPDSFLSEINRAAKSGDEISVDPETAELIDAAFRAYQLSDGLFDVTSGRLRQIWNDETCDIPDDSHLNALLAFIGQNKLVWRRPRLAFSVHGIEIDFGGIAKEYAADRAAAVCATCGARHGLINLGGDIAIIGPNPDGAPLRIGIRDPFGDTAIATLFISAGGIATSGDYERHWEIKGRRFSHLLDPTTGWPVEGLPSVTVVAESCMAAGMASTIAALKGPAGPRWLRETGAAHLYVGRDGALGGSIRLD